MKKVAFRCLYLFTAVLLLSCDKAHQAERIEGFILVGFSGFCYRDSTGRIYTIEEIDSIQTPDLHYDSSLLDIKRYFELTVSEQKVSRKLRGKPLEYLSIQPEDTSGLGNLLKLALLSNRPANTYNDCPEIQGMYSGYVYAMIFRTATDREYRKMVYSKECLPDSLLELHTFIEKLILNEALKTSGSFHYNPLITKLALEQYRNQPPPIFITPDSNLKIQFLPNGRNVD